jgi:hypothetical protein
MFYDSGPEKFGFAQTRPLLAVVFTSLVAMASTHALAEPLSADVQWNDPSSVHLEVGFPGNGYHASWDLYRCACGDLMIRSELNVPGEVVHGDIVLVDNRAVLLRGYDPESKEQISFDAPALMMQLALRLLERATPAGPSVIHERTEVAVQDDINFINLDTGAAAGGFPPPWSATGTIWPEGDSERRFELGSASTRWRCGYRTRGRPHEAVGPGAVCRQRLSAGAGGQLGRMGTVLA